MAELDAAHKDIVNDAAGVVKSGQKLSSYQLGQLRAFASMTSGPERGRIEGLIKKGTPDRPAPQKPEPRDPGASARGRARAAALAEKEREQRERQEHADRLAHPWRYTQEGESR